MTIISYVDGLYLEEQWRNRKPQNRDIWSTVQQNCELGTSLTGFYQRGCSNQRMQKGWWLEWMDSGEGGEKFFSCHCDLAVEHLDYASYSIPAVILRSFYCAIIGRSRMLGQGQNVTAGVLIVTQQPFSRHQHVNRPSPPTMPHSFGKR